MKRENKVLVDYCRKSMTNESAQTRSRLLQRMAEKLMRNFLVERVYASPRSSASENLSERDQNSDFDLSDTEGIFGNMQGRIRE